jgi:hypothetical protein
MREGSSQSKILTHFIKGKISLSLMETILSILGKLEYLESLMKLTRKKKGGSLKITNLMKPKETPIIQQICVNKSHQNKTLHLLVEISNHLVEGLVGTDASMSIMAIGVVCELGIMHLIIGSESYKTTSRLVTHVVGRINEIIVKVGEIQCLMTFMIINIINYELLLGLDFLIKIGAIGDVEKTPIQVGQGPRNNIHVLPLNMVNIL